MMQRPNANEAFGSMFGGDEGGRTPDLGIANAALSQLSYIPTIMFFLISNWFKRVNLKTGFIR